MVSLKNLKQMISRGGVAIALLLSTGVAMASDPTGVWLTKDKAEITISKCGADYCGVVSKPAKPGLRDIRNPDPALNGRPIMGMPLLRVSRNHERGKHPGRALQPAGWQVLRRYLGTKIQRQAACAWLRIARFLPARGLGQNRFLTQKIHVSAG